MINWSVRIKNKTFWIALIPAVLLLIQALAKMVGIEIEVEGLQENVLEVVNTMFAILAIVGVVSDPTTEGCTDSLHVMGYTCPVNKKEELAEIIAEQTATESTEETEQVVEDTVAETTSEAEVAAETATTTTTKKKSTKKTATETVEEGESNE